MSQLTPMMQQYFSLKSQYPGCILFFRLGDFYEMFGDDAKLAARLLQITLTSRDVGGDRRIPMCGVPYHSAEKYIADLIRRGYRVAVCEQVEDPKTAKGTVRREVVRVVTPGTVTEEGMLPARENNYLVTLCRQPAPRRGRSGRPAEQPSIHYGLAACDLSTGEFMCTQIEGPSARATLRDELVRLNPAEVLLDPSFARDDAQDELETVKGAVRGLVDFGSERAFTLDGAASRLLSHFGTESLEGFGCAHLPLAVRAAGAAIAYLSETQMRRLGQVTRLVTYNVTGHMHLDAATRRNLELTRTLREGERRGSLLWVLDRTRTSMGARLLRRWIEQPLLEVEAIRARLEAVRALVDDPELRFTLQGALERVYDVERLIGRVALGTANGRDLRALAGSLAVLPQVKEALAERAAAPRLRELAAALDPCADLVAAIDRALVDEPPSTITEGGLIRPGYSAEVDRLFEAATKGKEWIRDLEQRERERTQIRSLKVGFNKVFGYYIEVTKPNLDLVPATYERRQTLANAERFVTPELKAREAEILGAEERLVELEYTLFTQLRDAIAQQAPRVQEVARHLAELDVYASFAEVAAERGYVEPQVDEGPVIEIREGRHPVVEAMLQGEAFVPNDLRLDEETQVIVLTGPNMAGKSTYLRQTALIVLMAQIGSFVPAASARIGVVDRIFTRVGASDDLATGQSTFMVEMNEVANILNHATPRSLVILDEVGRGTSTFDGLSIAWAVTEYLLTEPRLQSKTLFATHYHELTELEELFPRVKNFSVAVHKEGQEIVFLRRIVPGGADQSYGIEVARLAGLPDRVIRRAREILHALESSEEQRLAKEAAAAARDEPPRPGLRVESDSPLPAQLPLFVPTHPVIERLRSLDVNRMTPLEALNLLAELVAASQKEDA